MKKALITGGQGFIGGHLVDRLIDDGYEVLVIDNQSSSTAEFHINAKAEYLDFDISDVTLYNELFDRATRYDYVFHLAGVSKVQESIDKPAVTVFDNVLGSCSILEFCKITKPVKVVFVSTCSVYGLSENVPFKEDEETDCLNPYSLTKRHAEELFQMYNRIYGVEVSILRLFNVFGPRAPKQGDYAPVVSKFMDQVSKGEKPTMYGTGANTRDYVHVEDVVNAMILAAESSVSLSGEIFNVGTGKDYSVREIVDMVRGDLEPEMMAPKQGECKKVIADITKIKKELGWKPKHNLKSYTQKEIKKLKKDSTKGSTKSLTKE